jgi:tetratricopeptide (TPR) repeat protein
MTTPHRATLAVAALASALLPAAAPVRAAPRPVPAAGDDAAVVADPPGWASLDADASLEALLGVVERDREGPLGQAALVTARALWDGSRDTAPHVRRLEAVLARGVVQGDTEEMIRRALGDRYLESGDDAKRAAVGVDAGYLGDFLICGPFGTPANAAVDVRYPPEDGLDLEKPMPGGRGTTRWMPYHSLGIGEIVEPFEYLRPTDGVAYGLAQVKSAKERPAVLKVTCRGSHAVFLNGAEVVRVNRLETPRGRTTWTPVTLAAGWNRLLVKVVGSQGFALKVADAERGHPVGLDVEKAAVLHPPVPALAPPGSVAYRSNLDALRGAEPAGPAARTVRGLLEEYYDLDWDAYEDLERAAADAPGAAGIRLRFAIFVQGFGEMPEPRWRRNRARAAYEDVLEAAPDHGEAVLALAQILHGEDRTEEALAGLKALPALPKGATDGGEASAAGGAARAGMERSRKVFPGLDALLEQRKDCAPAWWVRSQICQERGWHKEAQEDAQKAVAANPRYQPALNYLLRISDSYANAARSEELCRRILAVNRGNSRAARRLAALLRAKGDHEGALRLLSGIQARWPADFDAREERSQILVALQRWDEALAILRELQALSPLEESYHRKEGEVLRRKGDDEGARKAWERSLSLAPGQAALRRERERLGGGDFDFGRKWDVDGLAAAKECGGQEKYPRAVAVHVVDLQVIRANEDGSWSSITHDVFKILNEQGREKYSEITVPADRGGVLDVRAVSPEGEVFLPNGARGSTFTFEGLQAGWIVEYRYLNDRVPGGKGFDSGGWFFQDPGFHDPGGADPVVLSRLVVDLPEGMEPPLLLRNYGPRPEPKSEGGRRIRVFEKRDMERIENEPRMPEADEICPSARFYAAWDWEDVNLEALDYMERFEPSPLLEAKAREILGDARGNLARARALYDFVNREIPGNAGGWGPTGVLLEKSGNRFVLLGALLRAAGVPFDPVRVAQGPEEGMLWEVVSPELFAGEGIVVRGEDPGSLDDDAFLFPFARHTPFGRIPLEDRGKPAMIPGRAGPTLFRMPAGSESDLEVRCDFGVSLGAETKDTTFTLRILDPSDGAFGAKERVKDQNEDDRRKDAARVLERYLDTADLRTYSYPSLEKPGEPWTLEAAGGLPRALRQEGGETVLPLGPAPLEMARHWVERPDRTWPFVVRASQAQRDEYVFDLGSRWRVRRMPAGHTAVSRIGTYSLVVGREGAKVRVERTVRFGDCRYSPDEYRDFVAWCRAIDAAEEQRIVLEEAPR